MNKPTLEKDGLTYIWETNAHISHIKVNGTEITDYPFPRDQTIDFKYKNAVLGRPVGAEDYNTEENEGLKIMTDTRHSTIEENAISGRIGIYVLKP